MASPNQVGQYFGAKKEDNFGKEDRFDIVLGIYINW